MAFTPLSGRGKFQMALRNAAGLPGPMFEIGNQSVVKLGQAEQTYKRPDYTSIARADRISRRTSISGTLDVTFLELNSANLGVLLSGDEYTQTTSARAEAVFTPTTIANGDKYWVGAVDVGTLVVKDSAGSPATLVLDTDYSFDDESGMVTLLDVSGLTGPLKATVTPTASSYIRMLTASEREYFCVFDGFNTFDTGSPRILAGFYRCRVSPTTDFSLIPENDAEFPVTFDLLQDSTKTESGPYGQYGFYKAWEAA